MINVSTVYPGKTAAPDAAYPQGSAQNITTPGDGIGTPLEEQWVNDVFGFFQAAINEAGITPNGTPDSVSNPQILNAVKRAKEFQSVAELKTIAGAYDKELRFLVEYGGTGSGIGSGPVYWDAALTDAGNDGTIFEITAAPGTGRWVRAASHSVTIYDFGGFGDSVPDGSSGTDDTAKIVAADLWCAANDSFLYITPGKFLITSGITLASKVSLRGGTFTAATAIPIQINGFFQGGFFPGFETTYSSTYVNTNVDVTFGEGSVEQAFPQWWYGLPGITRGSHDAGTSATVMTDSGASFVPGAFIGFTILNKTDVSQGVVIANTETTITVTALTGGSDNDWDASDAYAVAKDNTGSIQSAIDSDAKSTYFKRGAWGIGGTIILNRQLINIEGEGRVSTTIEPLGVDISIGSGVNAIFSNQTTPFNGTLKSFRCPNSLLGFTGVVISAVHNVGAEKAMLSANMYDLWMDTGTSAAGFFSGWLQGSWVHEVQFENIGRRFNCSNIVRCIISNILEDNSVAEFIKCTGVMRLTNVHDIVSTDHKNDTWINLTSCDKCNINDVTYREADATSPTILMNITDATELNIDNIIAKVLDLTSTHTGGTNAVVMTDSTQAFTVDALIGYTIVNDTDGSSGVITDNDLTTVTVASLSGGGDNQWESGDTYTLTDIPSNVFDGFRFNNCDVNMSNIDISIVNGSSRHALYITGLNNRINIDNMYARGSEAAQIMIEDTGGVAVGGYLNISNSHFDKSLGRIILATDNGDGVTLDIDFHGTKLLNGRFRGAQDLDMISIAGTSKHSWTGNTIGADDAEANNTYIFLLTGTGKCYMSGNNFPDVSGMTGFIHPSMTQKVIRENNYYFDQTRFVEWIHTTSHDFGAAAVDWDIDDDDLQAQFITVTNASGAVNALLPVAMPGKEYTIFNNSGQVLTFKVTGQTGGTVAAGKHAIYRAVAADVIETFEEA